jgi:IPT/TIG domain
MSTTSGRLAAQRPTLRPHQRRNSRWYQRGYDPLPHGVWGDILELTPRITSLVPNTSVVSVAQTVQINGANFMPYSTVEIDGVDGPATYVSSTRLTVSYTPGNIGTYGVLVNNDDPALPGHVASNIVPYTVSASVGELDPHVEHPGNFTIAEIEAWVDDHPELADEVLAHEQARSTPRVTLIDWLQGFISHRDEGTQP